MKKIIAATMAVFVCVTSSQAAFVASEDVYGIINTPVSAGVNAVGVSLLPMPGDANATAVQDVILPQGLTAGDSSTGDKLQIFNGTTYADYWLETGTMKWVDAGGNSPAANLGEGMWIKAASAATIYQVGVMTNATSFSVPAAADGYSFIANPFPNDLDVDGDGANIVWTDLVAAGKTANTGDRLMIWTGTKYDTYYWFNKSGYSGWYSADNKGRRPPLIPAGEGFFFQRRTSNPAAIPVDNPFD